MHKLAYTSWPLLQVVLIRLINVNIVLDNINSAQSTPKSSASGCWAEPGFHLFP